jgi:hypothetical protein
VRTRIDRMSVAFGCDVASLHPRPRSTSLHKQTKTRPRKGSGFGESRYSAEFAERLAGLLAAKRSCASAMAFASASTMSRTERRSAAAAFKRSARSGNETFLFITRVMNWLVNRPASLLREHSYQHGSRPGERSRACPLTGRCGCQPIKESGRGAARRRRREGRGASAIIGTGYALFVANDVMANSRQD